MNIFFIHFNEKELKEKIQPLKSAGHQVNYHFSTETVADFKNDLPDVLVISFDKLPSHGRRYAEWLWGAKKRQHIPIICTGGEPEKILIAKEKLPKATFCNNDNLIATLEKIKSS